ncbi:hypothetical protein DL93DRAFT_383935 [Clavulina sp. PMI_390]|nr:hypothetical protein DL93DRAFT_383935 [Clavulina sp. PMI_390]
MMSTVEELKTRIQGLEIQLAEAKEQLKALENNGNEGTPDLPFSLQEYRRYGRQMILDGFGLPSQLKLKNSSVLVIGAGGLGCPALQYLSAAGIGTLGIVDHDVVEVSNLQRQILHTDSRIGWLKADSAEAAIKSINPYIVTKTYPVHLNTTNAVEIMSQYDLVLDCTDNPSTRYLISDTSRALCIPLVSGAAMRYDGQLCTYNRGPEGPCYRCIFPMPPKPESVGTCEDVGVLGVVTGVVGTLQAMEAIKLIISADPPGEWKTSRSFNIMIHIESFGPPEQAPPKPTMLLFSALSTSPFRTVKIRGRSPSCKTCSMNPEDLREEISHTDYVAFCGGSGESAPAAGVRIEETRITAQELKDMISKGPNPPTLIDTRPPVEFGICHLPNSTNIPLAQILADPLAALGNHNIPLPVPALAAPTLPMSPPINTAPSDILFVCRRGKDSQVAAVALRKALASVPAPIPSSAGESDVKVPLNVRDVRGGLTSWSRTVDPSFPMY